MVENPVIIFIFLPPIALTNLGTVSYSRNHPVDSTLYLTTYIGVLGVLSKDQSVMATGQLYKV